MLYSRYADEEGDAGVVDATTAHLLEFARDPLLHIRQLQDASKESGTRWPGPLMAGTDPSG